MTEHTYSSDETDEPDEKTLAHEIAGAVGFFIYHLFRYFFIAAGILIAIVYALFQLVGLLV